VLNSVGITEFKDVTIRGETGSITLSKDEVDSNVVLDFSNRGTLKLTSPQLPIPSPVQDIMMIEVK
jgi:hypothetical protein